jgi:shikimate dehydrogenase
MAARYAVFGQPIAHSLSPRIQVMFAEALGIALDYRAIECAASDFPAALEHFAATGGAGANVTLPLKEIALAACRDISARARRAGSINTLRRVADGWAGDNTDGAGLIGCLERQGVILDGRRVLLLGAGGAAAGVAPALLDAGVASLLVANRNAARAERLAARFGRRVDAADLAGLGAAGAFDLVVDATAAGHGGAVPDLPASIVGPHALCCSLSYGAAARGFLAWAERSGAARVLDGLGMLVEQAALSFQVWHGVRPDTRDLVERLRAQAA